MRNGEWRLVHPDADYTFGPADLPVVLTKAPDLGDVDIATDDAARPRTDGVAFGVDYRRGRTITFELGLPGADETEVRSALGALARAWRADAVRQDPGALAELHVRYVDRERVAFGRPRRFSADDTFADQGYITALADFATIDDVWYSSTENVESISFVPPPSGGLAAPLVTPLVTTPPASTPGAITVSGDLPAWPVITVDGPITSPEIQVTNLWTLALQTTIADGDALVVDTRPWRRSITRASDGASFAGALAYTSTRLSKASLPPGSYEIALRGTDSTGTSAMSFTWRDTFSTL